MLAQIQNLRPVQVLYGLTQLNPRQNPEHWIYRLCTNIVAQIPPSYEQRILRVKNISRELGNDKLGIKQSHNRVRLALEKKGDIMKVSVHPTTLPDLNAPYKPRYASRPTETKTFSLSSKKDYEDLVRFCAKQLSQETPYSRFDYQRIKVTRRLEKISSNVFLAGRITSAFQKDDTSWEVGVTPIMGDAEVRVTCDAKTLAGPAPGVGYILVYADNYRAEVLTEPDFQRYYAWVD